MKKLLLIISLLLAGTFGVQTIVAQERATEIVEVYRYVVSDDPANEETAYIDLAYAAEMYFDFEYSGKRGYDYPKITLEIEGDGHVKQTWSGVWSITLQTGPSVQKITRSLDVFPGGYYITIRKEKGAAHTYGKFTLNCFDVRSQNGVLEIGNNNSFILNK